MTTATVRLTPQTAQFTTVIVPEEATDGSLVYRAEIPELPGCMSHGESPEEALQNLEEARDLYIETLMAQRRPVPPGVTVSSTSGTAVSGAAAIRLRKAPARAELKLVVVS